MHARPVSSLVSGVQNHMMCPTPARRRYGMRIGERLGDVLSDGYKTEKKLRFEYDSDGMDIDLWSAHFTASRQEPQEDMTRETEDDVVAFEEQAEDLEDPDALYDGGAFTDEDGDAESHNSEYDGADSENDVGANGDGDESDDSLDAYDMEDDTSDLRAVPRPLYVRELLKLLRDVENIDSMEVALEAACDVIKNEQSGIGEKFIRHHKERKKKDKE